MLQLLHALSGKWIMSIKSDFVPPGYFARNRRWILTARRGTLCSGVQLIDEPVTLPRNEPPTVGRSRPSRRNKHVTTSALFFSKGARVRLPY